MPETTGLPLVQVEHPLEGCALVTLQRPQALNALSAALRRGLAQALQALAADGRTRVVVLTGAGRAFCAGLDLREMAAAQDPQQLVTAAATDDPVRAIRAFPGPVIAAVNGLAVTGGLEVALACDVLLASERASFADTHSRVGVLPSWGVSQMLPRLIGLQRAKEMSLGGNFIDAARAEAWGLVNRVVPHDELLPQALQLAADMLSGVPGILRAYKRLIDDGSLLPLREALAVEQERSAAWAQRLGQGELAIRREALQARARAQGRPQEPPCN